MRPGYRGGRRRPQVPCQRPYRSGVVHGVGRRRRGPRFEDDDTFDELSDEDLEELEDFLSDSEFSEDSEGSIFSDSSPRSFVRRDPWRHQRRRREGLFGDGGLGMRGPRRRAGHGGREFGGFGGGGPGMFGRDRHRTGHWRGSSHDTMESIYSDGETF